MAEIRHYGGDRNLEIVVSAKLDSLSRPCTVRSLPAPTPPAHARPYDLDFGGRVGSGKAAGGGGGSAWCFSDPEMKRRKRVASYKAYSVEGKIKGKFRRGWKWIKNKCHELVHGY